MTVTNIHKDTDAATMSITAEFDAGTDRVWQLWADPRLLERWWGPPEYPATVVDHDLAPGGHVNYYMTGPEGDRSYGLWRVLETETTKRIVFEDAFADADGNANTDMPVSVIEVALSERAGGGTTMTILTNFPSPEAMQQLVEMGMEEGMQAAMGQMDALLVGAR